MLREKSIEFMNLFQTVLYKIQDETGDPDGGGLSWVAKLAIGFSVIAGIGVALNAAFPGLLNTIFAKVASFFA